MLKEVAYERKFHEVGKQCMWISSSSRSYKVMHVDLKTFQHYKTSLHDSLRNAVRRGGSYGGTSVDLQATTLKHYEK